MSYEHQMNSYTRDSMNAFWTVYMVFGIGCMVFFFGGVCALLCCCRDRFRGIKRPGYIIREPQPEMRTPLMQAVATNDQGTTAVIGGNYPAQPPPMGFPQPAPVDIYPPSSAPPAYQSPPKF